MSISGARSSARATCRPAALRTATQRVSVLFNATESSMLIRISKRTIRIVRAPGSNPRAIGAMGARSSSKFPRRPSTSTTLSPFGAPTSRCAPVRNTQSTTLTWCDDVPAWNGYRVGKTRIGVGSRPETVRFVVDFLDWRSAKLEQVASVGITDVPLRPLPEAVIGSSAGVIENPLVQRNPDIGGIRATFELDPQGLKESELRLSLVADGEPASEVWLFRWRQ